MAVFVLDGLQVRSQVLQGFSSRLDIQQIQDEVEERFSRLITDSLHLV
jgi:hypothetical protein